MSADILLKGWDCTRLFIRYNAARCVFDVLLLLVLHLSHPIGNMLTNLLPAFNFLSFDLVVHSHKPLIVLPFLQIIYPFKITKEYKCIDLCGMMNELLVKNDFFLLRY